MSESTRRNGADGVRDGEGTTGSMGYVPPRLAPLARRNGFTQRELQLAFDRVGDPWDRGAPVWAQIPATQRALVEQAVLRFTGSQPAFASVPGAADRLDVFAPGARLGPVVGDQVDVFAVRAGMTMRSWDPRGFWTMLRDLFEAPIRQQTPTT